MADALNPSDYYAHTIEAGASNSFDPKPTMLRKGQPSIISEDHINQAVLLLDIMAGNDRGGSTEYFSNFKDIKPRKGAGFVGLSVVSLSSEIPFQTYSEYGFNFGVLIKKSSPDIKLLVASPLDAHSSSIYKKDIDQHEIGFLFGPDQKKSEFYNVVKNSASDKKHLMGIMEQYTFLEKELTEKPIEYSDKDVMNYAKSLGDFNNFLNVNGRLPWNESVINCRLGGVDKIFFSKDFVDIDKSKLSETEQNFMRDSQIINAIALSGALSIGWSKPGKSPVKLNLDICEYDSKNMSLNKVDVARERARLFGEYRSKIPPVMVQFMMFANASPASQMRK